MFPNWLGFPQKHRRFSGASSENWDEVAMGPKFNRKKNTLTREHSHESNFNYQQSNWEAPLPLRNFARFKPLYKKRKSRLDIDFVLENRRKKESRTFKRSKRKPWRFEIRGYWSEGSSSQSYERDEDASCSSERDSLYSGYRQYEMSGSRDQDYAGRSGYQDSRRRHVGRTVEDSHYFEDDFSAGSLSDDDIEELVVPKYAKPPVTLDKLYKAAPRSQANDSVVKSNLTVHSSSMKMKMSQSTMVTNTTNILYLVLPSKYNISDNSLVAITGNNTIVITQNMNSSPSDNDAKLTKGKLFPFPSYISSSLKKMNVDWKTLNDTTLGNKSMNYNGTIRQEVKPRYKREITSPPDFEDGEDATVIITGIFLQDAFTDMAEQISGDSLNDGKIDQNLDSEDVPRDEYYGDDEPWTEYVDGPE
jgi:hypothetical protein